MWDSHPLKPYGGPPVRLIGGALGSLFAFYQGPSPLLDPPSSTGVVVVGGSPTTAFSVLKAAKMRDHHASSLLPRGHDAVRDECSPALAPLQPYGEGGLREEGPSGRIAGGPLPPSFSYTEGRLDPPPSLFRRPPSLT